MISISQKAKENVSLTVSAACLLISALWIYYHATLTGDTNLSELTGFHAIMMVCSLPFGGLIGPYVAPALAALAGFFSTFNYWSSDRRPVRTVSRVALSAQGVLTVALTVFIVIALTC